MDDEFERMLKKMGEPENSNWKKLSIDKRSSMHQHKAPDRRSDARHKCYIQARALISIGDEDIWSGEGSILNISGSGMLFEFREKFNCEKFVPKDASVNVRLFVGADFKTEFEVGGLIVWTTYGGITRFGIRLMDPLPQGLKDMFAL